MFEVTYRKDGSESEQQEDTWHPFACATSVEYCIVDDLTDPTYVLGVGATIKVADIPKDAKEIYVFYHFTPGEDVDD